jgi:hypothetical protein
VVSPSWQLCKYLRNDTRNAIGDAKRGVLAELPPGIVQGKGAETAAARTVKKKKCTGSPLSPRLRKRPDSKKEIAKLLIQVLTYLYSSDDVFAKNGKSGLTKI